MSARIITVTPNPSIDLLFDAATLVWDDANRVAMPRRRAGGQGVNVTRAVCTLDGDSTAVALLGGAVGREIAELLRAERIDLRIASAPAETRVFVAVREHDSGRSLLLNPRGPECGAAEETALLETLADATRPGDWVVTSGSVPPGFAVDFHARVRDVAMQARARVVVDSDGPALHAAAPGCALLVPNVREAERLLGRVIPDVAEAARAARALLTLGATDAAITMGSAGAVLASSRSDTVLHAMPPAGPAGASAVGAGDAFLAGLLLRLGEAEPGDALRYAVAAGTAVLHGAGAELLRKGTVDELLREITMKEVD